MFNIFTGGERQLGMNILANAQHFKRLVFTDVFQFFAYLKRSVERKFCSLLKIVLGKHHVQLNTLVEDRVFDSSLVQDIERRFVKQFDLPFLLVLD